MNRLLDRLKQGLRRIGRGRNEVHPGPLFDPAAKDDDQGTRLRTELDDAPSSLNKRLAPAAPATTLQTGRTRKAILSKARRTGAPQNAMTFWGMTPVALTDDSSDPTPLVPASMLSGSSQLQRSPSVADVQRASPSGLLGGAIPFAETQEVAGQPSLLEPAPKLAPEEDRIDRPFWP
jgi:hypothetical protein